MRRIALLFLTLVFLSANSCKIDPPGEIILIPVLESNYRIGMREILVGNQRELRFSLATSEARHCAQALVENRFFLQNNQLRLDLLGIAQPATCTTGEFDAFTLTDGLVLPGTLYNVQIALDGAAPNTGTLRVEPDGYLLELTEQTGIELESDRLLSLPYNLVWGYVNFSDAALALEIRDRVRTDLENLGGTIPALAKGYYGYFRVGNNQTLTIPGGAEDGVAFSYLLPNEDDAVTLTNLAATWRNDFGPSVTVALFNTHGETF